jgi:calcium/calmodulin-dependent protein kinase kinase 2
MLEEHPWVTKGGTDRLLSSEENTADLVELPTDAELKNAITRSVKHAITVVRFSSKHGRLQLLK